MNSHMVGKFLFQARVTHGYCCMHLPSGGRWLNTVSLKLELAGSTRLLTVMLSTLILIMYIKYQEVSRGISDRYTEAIPLAVQEKSKFGIR